MFLAMMENENIHHVGNLYWWEQETQPSEHLGPKLWYRPSDRKCFARNDQGEWHEYDPINQVVKLKVGESVKVTVKDLH